MSDKALDPREIITPDAFTVAPELLGLPLARPTRRAAAMLVDLLFAAMLTKAGSAFFGILLGVALWRASSSDRKAGFIVGSVRRTLRLAATLILFVVVIKAWGAVTSLNIGGDHNERATRRAEDAVSLNLGIADLAALPDLIALQKATSPEQTRRSAQRVAEAIRGKDLGSEGRRELADGILESVPAGPARDALRSALGDLAGPAASATGNEDVIAYGKALEAGDSAKATDLRQPAISALAGERIASLQRQRDRLRQENADLGKEVEEARQRHGIRYYVSTLADDLGIGFGWFALYFTGFLAMWKGQTPGKRLFGLRVIRLDGKPIGWWLAFERFGGYAASASTGLLGFAQILWDRNRQALHDKAVETVVINERVPAPVRT